MEQQVMYRFYKIELEQFATFEENYDKEILDVQFQTEAQFSFDKEQSILCSRIIVTMSALDKMLLKAELKSYFDLLPDSVESLREDGRIVFPPNILVQFASLCYGTMRGVIFTKTIGSPLNNFVLPPVYFNKLIDTGFAVED